MDFDPRTLAVMIVVLTFLSAGMLALVARQARNVGGVMWWAWAELLVGTGLLVALLQNVVSPWLSFVVGNPLLVAGTAMTWGGLKIYKNEPPPVRTIVALVVASALLAWWFAIVEPMPAVRITANSLLYAVLSALAAHTLLVRVAQPLRTAYWITGSAFGIYGFAMLVRAVFIGLIDQGTSNFTATPVNMVTFILAAIAQLTITFGMILMVTYRMSMNMERLASLDALTGALNRRSLEQRATEVAARGAGRPIGVIMLDIDHFKQVNDRYGHAAGDYVLQQVTGLGRAQLRERDLFARMGGEEFCVVLAEGDEDRAVRIAERIREACAREPILFNGIDIDVRLSAGVAAGRVSGGALEDLIGQADLALYQAKQTGRNRVVAWSSIEHTTQPIPAQRIAVPESFPHFT